MLIDTANRFDALVDSGTDLTVILARLREEANRPVLRRVQDQGPCLPQPGYEVGCPQQQMLVYYGCWWMRGIAWTLQFSAIFVSIGVASVSGGVGGVIVGGMFQGTALFFNVLAANVC